MTQSNSASFNNNFGNPNRFGFNVKVQTPKETVKELKSVVKNETAQIANPFFNFLEKNESVFNGNVEQEIAKTQTQMFNTSVLLNATDEKINGKTPRFDVSW